MDSGNFGCSPKKKGKSPEVSREWKELIAVHINISQVSTVGEADGAAIKGTIRASIIGTDYEDKFNLKKAWEDIRCIHAAKLVPAGHLAADDIRYQWCTLTNIKDMQSKFKASISYYSFVFELQSISLTRFHIYYQAIQIKYGFAINEPEQLEDGTTSEITLVKDLLCRQICMDESHHPLDNDHDSGGPRAIAYINPSLNRTGARSTRSHHHVTGCYSVNYEGEPGPPMFIFSSKAKNPQLKSSWIEPLGGVKGKWGHATTRIISSMAAARYEVSMRILHCLCNTSHW